ncbi:GntR family transcriptional regulator [Thioclava sp. L04-15]|uniref:MocR-like pyridoxine biosynthesis transcription factor PdxR n=1 Tax=Thioclava sp. L04-15 TaxID=1915318 RepID=UPI000996123C|nr:PLP-dependent aminotransferase family protein [Thioclava sp. L04-15]OOY28874.1 GntR family transcriptional regulator [Thioclava sp. L04-15]TNE93035.1 MAG: PLP-dependent aminotransferase family protein [Paracoccaceae bacterium]
MSNINKKVHANINAALFALSLERRGARPLHAQLTDGLRELLRAAPEAAGLRLPASRVLAEELSVSRMTVTTAYDQLVAEGYLVTRQGGGTYVAGELPHLAPPAPGPRKTPEPPRPWRPFQPGLPDQSLFPHRIWARHLDRAWRQPDPALLDRPDSFGWPALRAAIASHLSAWRGLDCTPDQVLITSGAGDGFDLIGRALLPHGASMAIEDPGWATLEHTLRGIGITPVALRVDGEGLDPARLPQDCAAVNVTPSRHYPTGVAMPLARRLALLDWAHRVSALIVEDDYDSEFRYQGQPLPALAGLDGLQRVIYMGSFSKLLSPALRIGYLVVPEALISKLRATLAVTGSRASLVPQPALAAFMASGEFATHLRRMRRTYARRQAHLLDALAPLSDCLDLAPDPSGMHLCIGLRPTLAARITDSEISRRAAEAGLTLRALSSHSVLPDPPQGLLFGYAGFDESQISAAAGDLCTLLAPLCAGRS